MNGCDPLLAEVIEAIDAFDIPLHLAITMSSPGWGTAWNQCNDPRTLFELILRTHQIEALLPMARAVFTTAGLPQHFLDNRADAVVFGSQNWERYGADIPRYEVRRLLGFDIINSLLKEKVLPLGGLKEIGLNHAEIVAFLRNAGPPMLEDALTAAESGSWAIFWYPR